MCSCNTSIPNLTSAVNPLFTGSTNIPTPINGFYTTVIPGRIVSVNANVTDGRLLVTTVASNITQVPGFTIYNPYNIVTHVNSCGCFIPLT